MLQPLLIVINKREILPVPKLNFKQVLWIDLQIFNQNGFNLLIIFLHDVFVAESFFYLFHALHVCVNNFSEFSAVAVRHEVAPFDEVECQIEVQDKHWVSEIDERIAYRSLIFQIHRQVKIIVFSLKVGVNQL